MRNARISEQIIRQIPAYQPRSSCECLSNHQYYYLNQDLQDFRIYKIIILWMIRGMVILYTSTSLVMKLLNLYISKAVLILFKNAFLTSYKNSNR